MTANPPPEVPRGVASAPALAGDDPSAPVIALVDAFSAIQRLTEIDTNAVPEPVLLRRAADILIDHQDIERCSVYMRRGDSLYQVVSRHWSDVVGMPSAHEQDRQSGATILDPELPFVREAMRELKIAHCSECARGRSCLLPGCRSTVVGNCAVVPISCADEASGVIVAYHPEPDHFRFWTEHALRLYCSVLGHVMSSHRALRQLERTVESREAALGDAKSSLQHAIVERIRSSEALEASQQTLANVMSNVPGMAYRRRHDRRWTMTFSSEGCRSLTSWNPADLLENQTLAFADLVHPEDHETAFEAIDAAVSGGNSYQIVYRLTTRDGDVKWVEDRGRAIPDPDGATVALEGLVIDVTAVQELSQQLAYQASHDALTGLANRRELESRIRRTLTQAASASSVHALCYIDVDQFKVINDTCGHVAGDELLRQLCDRLRTHVRQRDTLARLGGDEFGLLLEHCTLDDARRVAYEVRRAAQEFRFAWEGKLFRIGVSIGLVPIDEHSESVAAVLSMADAACYAAKETGRNRVHVYAKDDQMLAQHYSEMRCVARINNALEEDRFRLYYQPILPVAEALETTGRSGELMPDHFEVLVRMLDEDGRVVPPGAFLPAAERYCLAAKIDRWVVEAAFRWLTANPGRLTRLGLCGINLSGQSLGDEEFFEFVSAKFDETGVPPERIYFEVTETTAIANFASGLSQIRALRERGCQFALDDFGSGHSSFEYLKNLPVDFVKIDGMFVKDILDDPMDRAMVKSINEIGHVLGKQTIAEFVENASVLAALNEIGIDYAQGYHIGRPVPLPALPPLPALSPLSPLSAEDDAGISLGAA